MSHTLKFLPAGDRALVAELGDTVDEVTNELVVALDEALAARAIPGIVETVPTYRSLLVMFDPAMVAAEILRNHIRACWPPDMARARAHRRWSIPVLYGGEAGADLAFVAETHGLSPEEVVRIHSEAEYRVYMIGFAPGFAYLGGLPDALHTSRRMEPRMRVPEGTIAIGGKQAAVFPPIALPSGWQLLGRTPVRTYDLSRPQPFLLDAGDRVVFRPISVGEFDAMSAAAASGEAVATMEMIDVR